MTTDMRATTWEDAAAKTFRFNSQNYIDQKLKSAVDGRAERNGAKVGINLSKPASKKFGIDSGGIFFPTDHMRRIIVAARAGQSLLQGPVFDGSETGDKVYETLSVIGPVIEPETRKPGGRGREGPNAFEDAALAGHDQLFRQIEDGRRADAGLFDPLRIIRERHLARACRSTTTTSLLPAK